MRLFGKEKSKEKSKSPPRSALYDMGSVWDADTRDATADLGDDQITAAMDARTKALSPYRDTLAAQDPTATMPSQIPYSGLNQIMPSVISPTSLSHIFGYPAGNSPLGTRLMQPRNIVYSMEKGAFVLNSTTAKPGDLIETRIDFPDRESLILQLTVEEASDLCKKLAVEVAKASKQ